MRRISKHLCAAVSASLNGSKVKMPDGGHMLWAAFRQLSDSRTYGLSGPDPLLLTEIEAYCRLMRTPLEPHHVQTLLEMDRVWLAHARAKKGDKVMRRASAAALTPGLFDAMFG